MYTYKLMQDGEGVIITDDNDKPLVMLTEVVFHDNGTADFDMTFLKEGTPTQRALECPARNLIEVGRETVKLFLANDAGLL